MHRPRTTAPARAAALAAAAALALSACSGAADAGDPTSAGDPANCPGEVVDVVVSVGQWGDLVRSLAGDCANVTTIVDSAAVDPHDFEPTAGDLAAFEDAELVVVNGAGYDSWASAAVATLDPAPVVVDAAAAAGVEGAGEHGAAEHETEHETDHGHAAGGANPHLWSSPDGVTATGAAVTAALSELSPDAAGFFAAQADAWTADLRPYRDAITALQADATGRSYAATETVFDPMAAEIGLTDATPPGYRAAASNETDPAPGDIAAFQAALDDGSIDVLVHNTQTEGSIPAQLRAAAEDAGVPVVEVTESQPAGGSSFVAWQLDQLRQLSDALGGT
ncbi:metal ABC transporter solute-binding protein, Zn/Mn family [Modestobacter lapidis]|nr:zinc ABC transporter solute-binding protein [Modestobacter lapidis]